MRYYWARRCAQIIIRAGLGTPQCRGEKSSTEVLRWRVEACPDLIVAFVQVAGTICSEHRRVPPPAASPSSSLATQRVKRAAAAWTAHLGPTLCGGQSKAAHFDARVTSRFEQETDGARGQHLDRWRCLPVLKTSERAKRSDSPRRGVSLLLRTQGRSAKCGRPSARCTPPWWGPLQ